AADTHEEAERGEVVHAVRAQGGDPRDRPGHHAADQELVGGLVLHGPGVELHAELLSDRGALLVAAAADAGRGPADSDALAEPGPDPGHAQAPALEEQVDDRRGVERQELA